MFQLYGEATFKKKPQYILFSSREPMTWAACVLSFIKWYKTLTHFIYITIISIDLYNLYHI